MRIVGRAADADMSPNSSHKQRRHRHEHVTSETTTAAAAATTTACGSSSSMAGGGGGGEEVFSRCEATSLAATVMASNDSGSSSTAMIMSRAGAGSRSQSLQTQQQQQHARTRSYADMTRCTSHDVIAETIVAASAANFASTTTATETATAMGGSTATQPATIAAAAAEHGGRGNGGNDNDALHQSQHPHHHHPHPHPLQHSASHDAEEMDSLAGSTSANHLWRNCIAFYGHDVRVLRELDKHAATLTRDTCEVVRLSCYVACTQALLAQQQQQQQQRMHAQQRRRHGHSAPQRLTKSRRSNNNNNKKDDDGAAAQEEDNDDDDDEEHEDGEVMTGSLTSPDSLLVAYCKSIALIDFRTAARTMVVGYMDHLVRRFVNVHVQPLLDALTGVMATLTASNIGNNSNNNNNNYTKSSNGNVSEGDDDDDDDDVMDPACVDASVMRWRAMRRAVTATVQALTRPPHKHCHHAPQQQLQRGGGNDCSNSGHGCSGSKTSRHGHSHSTSTTTATTAAAADDANGRGDGRCVWHDTSTLSRRLRSLLLRAARAVLTDTTRADAPQPYLTRVLRELELNVVQRYGLIVRLKSMRYYDASAPEVPLGDGSDGGHYTSYRCRRNSSVSVTSCCSNDDMVTCNGNGNGNGNNKHDNDGVDDDVDGSKGAHCQVASACVQRQPHHHPLHACVYTTVNEVLRDAVDDEYHCNLHALVVRTQQQQQQQQQGYEHDVATESMTSLSAVTALSVSATRMRNAKEVCSTAATADNNNKDKKTRPKGKKKDAHAHTCDDDAADDGVPLRSPSLTSVLLSNVAMRNNNNKSAMKQQRNGSKQATTHVTSAAAVAVQHGCGDNGVRDHGAADDDDDGDTPVPLPQLILDSPALSPCAMAAPQRNCRHDDNNTKNKMSNNNKQQHGKDDDDDEVGGECSCCSILDDNNSDDDASPVSAPQPTLLQLWLEAVHSAAPPPPPVPLQLLQPSRHRHDKGDGDGNNNNTMCDDTNKAAASVALSGCEAFAVVLQSGSNSSNNDAEEADKRTRAYVRAQLREMAEDVARYDALRASAADAIQQIRTLLHDSVDHLFMTLLLERFAIAARAQLADACTCRPCGTCTPNNTNKGNADDTMTATAAATTAITNSSNGSNGNSDDTSAPTTTTTTEGAVAQLAATEEQTGRRQRRRQGRALRSVATTTSSKLPLADYTSSSPSSASPSSAAAASEAKPRTLCKCSVM